MDVAETHQRLVRSRIEMMRGYAETTGCRRQFLLGYFGEQLRRAVRQLRHLRRRHGSGPPRGERPFPAQQRRRHAEWGYGVVMSCEQDRLTVLFDQVGYKTLALAAVERQKLLTRS